MANINRIIFIVFILFSTGSYSTTVDLSNQSNFAKSSSGLMWATQASGAPTGALITGNRASVPFQFNVPSGQSVVPVSGVRESNLSLNRIGKAATNFAKKVGPIGAGVAVAGLVCDLSNICDDGNDGWIIPSEFSDPNAYPQSTELGYWYYVTPANGGGQTLPAACSVAVSALGAGYTGHTEGEICKLSFNGILSNNAVPAFIPGSCSSHYLNTGSSCDLQESTESSVPTDQNWTDAETALNDEQFIQPLFDAGAELPVDQPDPFPPVNTITGSTTKTIRDGDGNIIGTEVTENTLTLSDVSSPDSPNLVDVTETKKVTTYDINNNITNTETSVSNPPPIEPPTEEQDQDIEFDDMAENELEEYEIPEINDFSSWGSGTCPPPIDIVTTHWNGQIDTQPICTYAEGLKPFVLLIAALSSAFIVSGSRQNVEV